MKNRISIIGLVILLLLPFSTYGKNENSTGGFFNNEANTTTKQQSTGIGVFKSSNPRLRGLSGPPGPVPGGGIGETVPTPVGDCLPIIALLSIGYGFYLWKLKKRKETR